MKRIEYFVTQTVTFQFLKLLKKQAFEFFETFGRMAIRLFEVIKYILTGQFSYRHVIEQCSRFAIDSLPITLTIVAMTSIILAVQIIFGLTILYFIASAVWKKAEPFVNKANVMQMQRQQQEEQEQLNNNEETTEISHNEHESESESENESE